MHSEKLSNISAKLNTNTDKDLLPQHYVYQELPYYKGDGNLSVHELQTLCNQFTEYCHQQAVIKQRLQRCDGSYHN